MNVAQDLVGGRYRLLEIIGAGGMGRVWLADDELLRRRVAVKEIGTPSGDGPARVLDAHLTTIREARAAAQLDHPGVVGIYDVVRSPDRSWIIMEYVESRSLDAVVREDGPLPHREAARIGLGVLAALRAAHRAGVLHRDVKPHNVLLATDGRVVLTDFGLATIKGTENGSEPLMASPYFVAPERMRGDDAGEAADLWSLGATLYAAVEGQAPFQRQTIIGSLTVMMTEPPDPARFPGPLTPIIDGLLIKDPAHRMTANDAQSQLQWVADHAVGIVPMRARRRRTPTPAGPPTPRTSTPGTFTPGRSTVGTPTPSTPTPKPSGTSALSMSMILGRLDNARPARRGIARSTKIALVATAVLLAGTTGTALAVDRRPGATPAAPTTVASAGPVAPCAAGGRVVTGKTESRGYAVPAGWLWHSDPTGFEVAVPQGWARSQNGTAACFRDPGGSRSFRVDASARLTGSALPYWREQEQNALTAGKLPGYQRVTMSSLPDKQDGAVWEFTWQPEGEPARRHERRLLLPMTDERAYLVEWTTPEQDWTGNEPYLRLVLASLS